MALRPRESFVSRLRGGHIVGSLSTTSQAQRAISRTRLLTRHFSNTGTPLNRSTTMSFPETMKAIAIDKTGDVDVLEVKTVPFPAPTPGNVIIKASSLLSYPPAPQARTHAHAQ